MKILSINKGLVCLLSIILTTGCVKKETPQSISDSESSIDEDKVEEYIFYDLKIKNEGKNGAQLPPLTPLPLWEHEKFISKIEQHLKKSIPNLVSFSSSWPDLKYKVVVNTKKNSADVRAYTTIYAQQSKELVSQIDKLYLNNHYRIIEVVLNLPDESTISTTLNIQKLREQQSNEAYLILEAVEQTTKPTNTDSLAYHAITATCKEIMSVELNPFFCGELKKTTILDTEIKKYSNIYADAIKTKDKKYQYGYDGLGYKQIVTTNDSNTNERTRKEDNDDEELKVIDEMKKELALESSKTQEQEKTQQKPKSDLTESERLALEEAGFEVNLK